MSTQARVYKNCSQIKEKVGRRPRYHTIESEKDNLVWYVGDLDDEQFGIIAGTDGIVMTFDLLEELEEVIHDIRYLYERRR